MRTNFEIIMHNIYISAYHFAGYGVTPKPWDMKKPPTKKEAFEFPGPATKYVSKLNRYEIFFRNICNYFWNITKYSIESLTNAARVVFTFDWIWQERLLVIAEVDILNEFD